MISNVCVIVILEGSVLSAVRLLLSRNVCVIVIPNAVRDLWMDLSSCYKAVGGSTIKVVKKHFALCCSIHLAASITPIAMGVYKMTK